MAIVRTQDKQSQKNNNKNTENLNDEQHRHNYIIFTVVSHINATAKKRVAQRIALDLRNCKAPSVTYLLPII
jgi:hypothetical protein